MSEIELFDTRKQVLYYLYEQPGFEIGECAGLQPSHLFTRTFIRDQYYLKYWQRGLQDLNEVIHYWNCPQNTDGLQCGLHVRYNGSVILSASNIINLQNFNLNVMFFSNSDGILIYSEQNGLVLCAVFEVKSSFYLETLREH